MSDQNGGEVIK